MSNFENGLSGISEGLKRGDVVVLNGSVIPCFHGKSAVVDEVTDWGAHLVACEATGTGRYRALFQEMEKLPPDSNGKHPNIARKSPTVGGIYALPRPKGLVPKVAAQGTPDPRDMGYTGDICMQCGSARVRRNGNCLTCEGCGANSGCG